MYSTIYKIPITFRKHTIYLQTETRFPKFRSLLLVSMAHFALRIVPYLSLVLILIYGNSEQKFLFFKKYISPV